MKKYNVRILFIDTSELNLNLEYEKLYDLQTVVSSYGKNGVWESLNDNVQIFHPSHTIDIIEVTKI